MESDNQSCSGAVAAGGRLLVDESSSNVQKDRKRFQIELKHGETTIVSWVKLLKESGISVDCPTPSPEPPEWFHEEDELRSECPNIFVNKEQKSPTKEHCQPKKQRTNTSQVLERINVVQVIKNSKMGHARVKSSTGVNCDMKLKLRSDCGMTCDEAAVCGDISEEHPVINGRNELPDLNVPYTRQSTSTSPRHIKDECCGILLKSSILEMEAMVAEARQLDGDVEDLVATKSRLLPEIKQKLKTIARLAHSSQGRIPDELIMRIMSQLGHWLKPRTLKRWLRDMVPSDLSSWDAVQLIQIKKEVPQMIKSVETKFCILVSQDKSSNETMELQATHKTKYSMDHEMEDKICDFYDIYVQGTKEIKNSEIRKFYIQFAQLWPKGTMDNHGIRNAICRAKERRRTLLQEKGHEKGKGKKSIS